MPPLLDVPSLRQLRGFEAVARLKSFSGAAREVNLSQPALTQSVHALEARLATRLFERRHSGCFATEPAAILLPRVRRFFDHIRAALGEPTLAGASTGRQNADAILNKITRPQLRGLIAISENHSLEAAARWLGISEPSLHRSARQLERELRRSLFQRTARGVTTTAQGSELARRFQVARREIEYGLEEVQAARGVIVSRIAIGNIPHSASQVLSNAIQKLLAAYPDTQVQVVDDHYDALLGDLRAGKLDVLFGVLRRPAWAVDTNEEFLFANPYTVVARGNHPLTKLRRITLRDLAAYDWVLPERGTPRREAFERLFAKSGYSPRVSIETTSPAVYRSILASSDRIALFSKLEAEQTEVQIRPLARLPFNSNVLSRTDGVATRADWQPTRVHRAFLDLMREETRHLRAGKSLRQCRNRGQSRRHEVGIG
ncbi:MAG TPA: LysR family transcriptional regulator [Xanthobacteraceae bacterium]|nr:LysR family transcriptional regulator [Xanthobacteraceae bacterium]